jgi:hypothetical protein
MYKCCCLPRLVINIVYRSIWSLLSCLVEANGSDRHILARQDNVQWNTKPDTNDNPILSYSYQGDTRLNIVQIEMICTPDSPDSLEVLGEFDPGNYQFKLSSKCACWNGCQGKLF